MKEDTFHFGDVTFVAVYDARKAGVIPQCEAIHRADRRARAEAKLKGEQK